MPAASRTLPWSELDDLSCVADFAPFAGYDLMSLLSFARQQLDDMREAARRDHGMILVMSV